MRDLIIADTHAAGREYARNAGIRGASVRTTPASLRGIVLADFQLHFVHAMKWRTGVLDALRVAADAARRPLSTFMASGTNQMIANPDGTITNREGRIVGGWGTGGEGGAKSWTGAIRFEPVDYPLHPLMQAATPTPSQPAEST